MRNIFIQSGLVVILVLAGLGGNAYLYQAREEARGELAGLDQSFQQKQALIKLASQKPDKPSIIGHRLAIPCNRLSVSEDFQQLSKTLRLARLDFQISPETTVENAFSESIVELKFQNQSDQPLFHMIAHLMDEFPGLVYPMEIVMWREPSQDKPLISGTFRFSWLKGVTEKVAS